MNTAIVNFNGGEYTAKIDARSDTEKYAGGCRQSDNMIPSKFGGSEKRPGTEFIINDGAFDVILSSIIAHNEIVVCWENDVMCYENEVVSDAPLSFLSKVVCYENNMVFYEGEVIYI